MSDEEIEEIEEKKEIYFADAFLEHFEYSPSLWDDSKRSFCL